MLSGSLERTGIWERTDTFICMAESFYCPPETITTLLTGYAPIQTYLPATGDPTLPRQGP